MSRKLVLAISTGAIALVAATTPAIAKARGEFSFRAFVPVVCNLQLSGDAFFVDDDRVVLGDVREMCNGPSGYRLVVNYEPGTLIGANLYLGGDFATLDGSGEAVLVDASWAAVRTRQLELEAGDNGFDALALDLDIMPKS